jgi:heat shock protein HspQ
MSKFKVGQMVRYNMVGAKAVKILSIEWDGMIYGSDGQWYHPTKVVAV